MTVGGVTLTFEHHHRTFLLNFYVVATQVPWGREYFRFNQLGDPLQRHVCLFLNELVSRIRDFISAKDFGDPEYFKPVLALTRTFILADHLRSHPIFELFFLEVVVKLTKSVSVYLNFDLFKTLLQDRLAYMREESHNVIEVNGFILL